MRLFPAVTVSLITILSLGCGRFGGSEEHADVYIVEEPVVDTAADVVEVPAVPCAGAATHFPQHGATMFLVFHDEKTDTRFQWVMDNVRRSDDGAYCEVASGPSKGEFVPMSCLQPVDGTTAPVGDCPVAVTCLYRSESGNDCATGTRPVAGPANDVTAEEAYRLAASAYKKADRSTAPAAPVIHVDSSTNPPTLTNVPAAPATPVVLTPVTPVVPTPPTPGLLPVPPAATPVVNAPTTPAPTSPPLPRTGA